MKILLWPHPLLKTPCKDVDPEDTECITQLEEMEELMRRLGGIGLAANQVGIMKRMLVAVPGSNEPTRFFINPRIVRANAKEVRMPEGCLSIPGIQVGIPRSSQIEVSYDDPIDRRAGIDSFNGQLAHVLQHEIDHLEGKTMIDDLGSGEKDRIRAALRKRQSLNVTWRL
jgi:peptide deformylase